MKAFVFIFVLAFAITASAIPQLINYQGLLTSISGTPLDTTVSMTFKIYSAASGGTALWTEAHPSVSVTDGLFQASLGSITSLTDQFVGDRWMGITVGNNSEMSPREQLKSVAYSYRVGTVDGASGGSMFGDVVVNGRINAGSGNTTLGNYANVHGQNNTVNGHNATVSGGFNNSAFDSSAVVGGGSGNRARGKFSTIGGGGGSAVSDSNSAVGDYSVVAGGRHNTASSNYSSIDGGLNNSVSGNGSSIGGGTQNNVQGDYSTAGGGTSNLLLGYISTVSGGQENQADTVAHLAIILTQSIRELSFGATVGARVSLRPRMTNSAFVRQVDTDFIQTVATPQASQWRLAAMLG